ncbi:hypothetical protein ACIQVL_44725 [Streptomyces sp. NPDC090499]|uniref:hypothetical protein n=1 Tax=Streptomyces sp. NPDC090499 TaxID=3365965 RepID=UPI003808B92D
MATTVNVTDGVGGLGTRYDERHHFGPKARTEGGTTQVTAWAAVAGLLQEWHDTFPSGPIELRIEFQAPNEVATGGDRIRLLALVAGRARGKAAVLGSDLAPSPALGP